MMNSKIMRKNAKVGRSLSILCAIFMYGSVFFYHVILPFTSGKMAVNDLEIVSENSTVNLKDLRALPYPAYESLFNVYESPIYEIFFFGQIMSGFVISSITIGASKIAAVFVTHICGQLEIVMALRSCEK